MRMSRLLALGAAVLATLPVTAQVASVRPPSNAHRAPGVQGHVFVPGFGLRPIIVENNPVFGLGFDAHHHFVLNRRRLDGFQAFPHSGFFGGFHSRRGFGFVGFPFFPVVSSSSSVVVVPQIVPQFIPVQVPVITLEDSYADESVVLPGLPSNWNQLRVVQSSYAEERPVPLLVLKNHSIIPVADYWLEDGWIFYVTSTGRQNSIELSELDWDMTVRLNADRNVDFTLRSPG
jgi:hypothetical protein